MLAELNTSGMLQAVSADAVRSCAMFGPELAVIATIVLLLLGRLLNVDRYIPSQWIAVLGAFAAFLLAWREFYGLSQGLSTAAPIFGGLAVFDAFTVFFRLFLLLFVVFVMALASLSGVPDSEDSPDFHVLLLGSTLGMMVMASANHLLMLFVGVEMASVPSYVMAGFLKGRRQSSEASLKFVVYGAASAGVMLYGISLLAGLLGTADFGQLAKSLALVASSEGGVADPVVRCVLLAMFLTLVGFAFKLSIFPFHFWTPDVFHGAAAEVGAFLSIASKAAAFGLLCRFLVAMFQAGGMASGPVFLSLGIAVGVVASLTATFGNLAAYSQTNLKRLLAYSTIAHAGYILMAISALLVFLNAPANSPFSAEELEGKAARAIDGMLYYLSVYLFMNLGAFAVTALIRNETFSEEIDACRGIVWRSPLVAICMAICMFSLVGLPPLGGFFGKLVVFASVFDSTRIHWAMWIPLIAGGLNTVFSLVYYLNVLKLMIIRERPESARPVEIPVGSAAGAYLLLVTAPVLLLGVVFNQYLAEATHLVARSLFP